MTTNCSTIFTALLTGAFLALVVPAGEALPTATPLDPAAADSPDLSQPENDWLLDQSRVHDEP